MIKQAWQSPDDRSARRVSPTVHAQARGVDVLRKIVARHPDQHIVIATHGNLMALMMNGLDRVV